MNAVNTIGLVLAILVTVFLVVALVFAERL